jgi:hypothetical protein
MYENVTRSVRQSQNFHVGPLPHIIGFKRLITEVCVLLNKDVD